MMMSLQVVMMQLQILLLLFVFVYAQNKTTTEIPMSATTQTNDTSICGAVKCQAGEICTLMVPKNCPTCDPTPKCISSSCNLKCDCSNDEMCLFVEMVCTTPCCPVTQCKKIQKLRDMDLPPWFSSNYQR